MRKPCEYCGADLPAGVNKNTRRVRSWHFEHCKKKSERVGVMIKQQDNEPRIAYLLRVLEQYMTDYGEFTVDYDDTTCDGMRLFEDIRDQILIRI